MEKEPKFLIEPPKEGDELAIGPMHVRSWKESYINPEFDITEEAIEKMVGHLATKTNYRKGTIMEALANPDKVLYRVVRNSNGDIVGFLHATKGEEFNELEAVYLLNEAKGSGTGGLLMEEFLAWADKDKPSHLEVLAYNDRALGYYTRYGFVKTDKTLPLYKDKLPVVEMIRPAENSK